MIDTGKTLDELEKSVVVAERLATPQKARKVCELSRTAFATCYAALSIQPDAANHADMARLKRLLDRALKALVEPEPPPSREVERRAVSDACENIQIRQVWAGIYLDKGAGALVAAIGALADADEGGNVSFGADERGAVDQGVRDAVHRVMEVIVTRERKRDKDRVERERGSGERSRRKRGHT